MQINLSLAIYLEMFFTPNASTGRKRPFIPKPSKHGNDKDAKRRKVETSDDNQQGSKKFNKSNDKHVKKEFKPKGEQKFAGKAKAKLDKSNDTNTSKKNAKKLKPKKTKGKKKSHRNKNK